MNIQQIHKKLSKECPVDYRINEIIKFGYPFRRIKVKATVNKSPEESIQQIYSTFLKAINLGYDTEEQLITFLGLSKGDFILRELYTTLREKGYVDLISGKWIVSEQGNNFVRDNSVLRVLEEEEFEFLLDAVTNTVIAKRDKLYSDRDSEKLQARITLPIKSPEILEGQSSDIEEIYRNKSTTNSELIDYDSTDILFDKKEYNDYCLIEYTADNLGDSQLEPFIEIRNIDKELSKENHLTKVLSKMYPQVLYDISSSERSEIPELSDSELSQFEKVRENSKQYNSIETLGIWETQHQFYKSIQNAKKKLLIESPWIKKATLKYVSELEKALKRGVEIYVLYGTQGNDKHFKQAIEKLEQVNKDFSSFHLIHLPTHLRNVGNTQFTGTHRKLVIKDNDYFILGSFNFLSLDKREGQKIANEESSLIKVDCKEKWADVFEEYRIES